MSPGTAIAAVVSCLALLPGALGPLAAEAASCAVPSPQYPTIQSAVDDPACTVVVLAAQTYVESVAIGRSLTVQGVSSAATVVQGQVRVQGGTVALAGLRVDTSPSELRGRFAEALLVETGGRVSGTDLVVVHRPLLFGDGFESGTTAAWSATAP